MTEMKRKDALGVIMRNVRANDAVVSTTGLISREIFEKYDSERNIYVPGSMGLVSSIGLGIAISCTTRVVIIDGDASLLMNLGSLVSIGHRHPQNLLHVVIDNASYGSCSEETSMSSTAHFDKLAHDVGYRYVQVADSCEFLESAIIDFNQGPGFILVKIGLGGERNFQRPMDLVNIKNRFMKFLSGNVIEGEYHDV